MGFMITLSMTVYSRYVYWLIFVIGCCSVVHVFLKLEPQENNNHSFIVCANVQSIKFNRIAQNKATPINTRIFLKIDIAFKDPFFISTLCMNSLLVFQSIITIFILYFTKILKTD